MDFARSVYVYKVFRNIYIDGESYSVQLELKHGLDDEEAEQVILEASDKDFLEVVKDSDPRRYEINYDRLLELWYSLWSEEIGERPVTPENFESFLRSYCRSYFQGEKHSTMKEMLVDEFYLAINSKSEKLVMPADFRELRDTLNEFEGKRAPAEHFQYGLNHR